METLNFDLSVVEIPVTITKQDGTQKECLLCEASEDAACKFTNARTACLTYVDGDVSKIKDAANVEPLLVSLCLFELKKGEDGSVIHRNPIQVSEVRSWPSRVVKELFDKAKEISHISDGNSKEDLLKQKEAVEKQLAELEEADEKAKNLENATTDGSV